MIQKLGIGQEVWGKADAVQNHFLNHVGYTMNCTLLLVLTISVWIGVLLIATYVILPKAIQSWQSWKKTSKSSALSNTIMCSIAILCLIGANWFLFLKALWKIYA